MNDLLVKMVNGGIEDFTYSQEGYGGCPTCNYGSHYIDEFTVHLTNFNIRVKVTTQYYHGLTEAFLMKFFIGNIDKIKTMTEEELFEFIDSEEFTQAVEESVGHSMGEFINLNVDKIYQ